MKKAYPISMIAVLILLIINFSIALYEFFDYQKRVDSGNERWEQVEERIKKIEEMCNGRNG